MNSTMGLYCRCRIHVLITLKRQNCKNAGRIAHFGVISELWPMIFHSATPIPFWFYILCVICITYNHKIKIPPWDHVGAHVLLCHKNVWNSKKCCLIANFRLISDLWPMIFQSAMQIPFCFYFLCVICVKYLIENGQNGKSWPKAYFQAKTQSFREFSKIHKKIYCGDPKFLLLIFVIKGQLFLQLSAIFGVLWWWRARLRTCENARNW